MKITEARAALIAYITGLDLTITGVFDEPPRHDPFPFVRVGDAIATPDDLLVERGSQQVIEIHVFTREPQRDQVNLLVGQLHQALHRATFDVEGCQNVQALVEQVNVFEDAGDPAKTRQWHGIVRVRVILFNV